MPVARQTVGGGIIFWECCSLIGFDNRVELGPQELHDCAQPFAKGRMEWPRYGLTAFYVSHSSTL